MIAIKTSVESHQQKDQKGNKKDVVKDPQIHVNLRQHQENKLVQKVDPLNQIKSIESRPKRSCMDNYGLISSPQGVLRGPKTIGRNKGPLIEHESERTHGPMSVFMVMK